MVGANEVDSMHFPEPFLWHTFYYLAKACVTFEAGPFKSIHRDAFGQQLRDGYLLHGDIKPSNILLDSKCYAPHKNIRYPIPKFADFGSSVITHPRENDTIEAKALQRGTRLWLPPELRIKYMQDPHNYYFGKNASKEWQSRNEHHICPKANIWAIGAIMWSLMTLEDVHEFSDRVNRILMGETEACAAFDGTNIINNFSPTVMSRYSKALLKIIKRCTRVQPGERPSARVLHRDLKLHMSHVRHEINILHDSDDDSQFRVYLGNDINRLPDGDANLSPKDDSFWKDFADYLIWLPVGWGPLCPPSAPATLPLCEEWPDGLRKKFRTRWQAAVRMRDRMRSPLLESPTSPIEYLSLNRKRKASNQVDHEHDGKLIKLGKHLKRCKWWAK